jgi:hypothetical protein
MRVLVCGGRDFSDTAWLYSVLDDLKKRETIDCIIEGDAKGADRIAGYWAKKNRIDLKIFPADWASNGKAAGPLRNQKMIDDARPDLVIAFPRANGEYGVGTKDMMMKARNASIETFVPAKK